MLSTIEFRLLVGFSALVLLLGIIRTIDATIVENNRNFEKAQSEKVIEAGDQPKISFTGCNPCGEPAFKTIIALQVAFLVISLGCLFFRNLGLFIISTASLLLVIYGYINWIIYSYQAVIGSEIFDYRNTTVTNYILVQSTTLDFILFLAVSVLLIVQVAILIRVAGERIYARLISD